ncbi:hypothetical protein GPJ56_001229 [Histomonas meleagridis]|uniref:uncharacterized protein n=1 Tax=Histomonas meleagridis TaxID=135588 RepID=UPI00355A6315|nr:hypothetical protein GPJ56_001229 [Histomonas meleagridis]KAH0797641.1 hypothetical protein GO595_009270 [Histomonas meleagridis]
MKSGKIYISYIPQVIETQIQPIWADTVKKFTNLVKGKSEDVIKEFQGWPRCYETYYECTKSIVEVGISSPYDAIEALLMILPQKENVNNIYSKISSSLSVDQSNPLHKECFDLLIYFLFADTVSQLMTYDNGEKDPHVLNACVALLKKEYGKAFESKYRPFLEQILIVLLRQCSVLMSLFATSESLYKQSVSTLCASLSEKDPTIRSRVITLYRLLRHPHGKALSFISEYLLPQLSDKKMSSYLPIIYDSLKNSMLQISESKPEDLAELDKIFSKPDSCIKKTAIEYQSILLSRKENVTAKKCCEFFEKIPKESESQAILQAFLNVIRGPYFVPDNEFWEYGEKNGRYLLILEKGQLLFPDQQQDLKDKTCFCKIFLDYVADKMNSSKVATKIIFNMFSRNLIGTVSCLLDYYKNLPINDERIGPFFNALTLVFDNSVGFVEGGGDKVQGQIDVLRTYMKPLIEQKLRTFVPPEMAPFASVCKTISVQECPQTITIEAQFCPDISGVGTFRERIHASRNKILDIFSKNSKEIVEYKKKLKVVARFSRNTTTSSDRTAMYLFSLIYQIVNKADATEEYFLPIVKSTICDHFELAFFAQYALQIFYINKPFTVQPILSAINTVLSQTIGNSSAFTLINLLYQLISLPRMVVKDEDKEWFNNWTTKLQALLLIHLTSPFTEIHDVVLLTMQRLDTICDDYGIDTTIFSSLTENSNQISKRVSERLSKMLGLENTLENIYFEDAARFPSILIYTLFLSEFAEVCARNEIQNVIQEVWKLNLQKYIEIPTNVKEQIKDEEFILIRIVEQYVGKYENDTQILNEVDKKSNERCIENTGKLLLISFVYLSSNNEESRKLAFQLLRRILPIFCSFNDPSDIKPSSIINTYIAKHKVDLSGLGFPPSPTQLFEFSNIIAQNMPFISHSIFTEILNFLTLKDEKDSIDPQTIDTLLNVIAPFARLIDLNSPIALPNNYNQQSTFTPFSIITSLISKFQNINKSNYQNYTRIFIEICNNQENVKPLLQILVMIAAGGVNIPAIQTICLALVQTQTSSVLTILTQPLTFASWFNNHIASTKLLSNRPYSPYNWTELSLNVIHEIVLSNVTLLLQYIHIIIHYCLLFVNDTKNILHIQILSLLQAIFESFPNPINIDKDFIISYTNTDSSTCVSIKDIINLIIEQLQIVFPDAINSWSEDALQWATGCGNLKLAYESCIIYSYTLNHASPEDSLLLMNSLDIVLNQKVPPSNEIIHNEILPYIHSILVALYKITQLSIDNGTESLLMHIFQFVSTFIDLVKIDAESSNLALQVLLLFINTKTATTVEQIAPHLLSVAKMLPFTFNDSNVSLFLTSIIYNLPPSISQSVKVISLSMMLPIIFSVVSAFHSIDPYSTFVSDDSVINVFDCARIIGESEFAGEAKYAEIFSKYFGDNSYLLETITPEKLLDVITKEIWDSDPEEVKRITPYYKAIAQQNKVPAIRSATFASVISFLNTSTDKDVATNYFIDIIKIAIEDNNAVARSLIALAGKITKKDGIFADLTPLSINQNEPEEDKIQILAKNVRNISQNIIPQYPTGGEVIIQDHKWAVPMISLSENSQESCQDQINSIKSVVYQPFAEQLQFWSNVQAKPQQKMEHKKVNAPSLFDMFAHSKAKAEKKTKKYQMEQRLSSLEPQNFVLRDEELEEFERRLNF